MTDRERAVDDFLTGIGQVAWNIGNAILAARRLWRLLANEPQAPVVVHIPQDVTVEETPNA